MAQNSLLCADVPLRNYSLTHGLGYELGCLVRLCFFCNIGAVLADTIPDNTIDSHRSNKNQVT